jgi:hypothetical protein
LQKDHAKKLCRIKIMGRCSEDISVYLLSLDQLAALTRSNQA